jgi:2-phospho-L-lactate guanylyltransferase
METVAVLPVKTFARAKHRLSEAVDAPDRRLLAQAMLGDVLEALGRVAGVGAVIVVTAEPLAVAAAREAGALVVHDPEEAGQSAAAGLGVAAAVARGAGRVLLVPGDCPTLDAGELSALLAGGAATAPAAPRVVIVSDRHGTGTNALLLAPPGVLAPAFGPGSFARHVALAEAAAATVEVAEVPSLCLDVDTPGDLGALRAALAARPHGALRTRAALERLAAAPA